MPVAEVVGTVLRRVAEEAARVAGAPPDGVVLTYPAGWSRVRLVARRCGLGSAETLRRAFAAEVGVAPAAYRARFASTGTGAPVWP